MASADYFGNLGTNIMGGALNTAFGMMGAKYNAGLNYHYNELASINAYKRTRALYEDYLSPTARIRQLKEAGLSPSLFADGAGGGAMGMTQGAQGGGASGVGLPTGLITPESLASVELMKAQAQKANAETKNIDTDTDIKEIQKNLQDMQKGKYSMEYTISMSGVAVNGQQQSIYEYAQNFANYKKFAESLRSAWTLSGNNEGLNAINSEYGQEVLKQTFLASKSFDRDIAVFKADEVDAKFCAEITKAMNTEEFVNANADAALNTLKSATAEAHLSEKQRNAWNDVIERLQKWKPEVADIVIVVSMILDRAASSYKMPNISGDRNITVNNNKK